MLIPIHFTIAQNIPVDPTTAIEAGQLVSVSSGKAVLAPANASLAIVGIAGDSTVLGPKGATGAPAWGSNVTAHGYAADIVVNANGDTVRSMNRISDLYNEVKASGLLTVYSGAGVFLTDKYDADNGSSNVYATGKPVYLSAGTAGNFTCATTNSTTKSGSVVATPTAYPNGVPGVDVQSSMSLGTFLKVSVNI